jgi:putative DNA primase/helicase
VITGDPIKHELKGQDEREFLPNCICLFNLNDVPSLKGDSNSIKSRLAVVEFLKVFKKNADPSKGEMEVDPRFKYDRDFLKNNVLPAFVNRLVASFIDLMQNGIDYDSCDEAILNIRLQNSHLLEFATDTGLSPERGAVVPVKEVWEALEKYYLDTGVLVLDDSGKRSWADPIRPGDPYVKGSNQVANRLLKLFPGCKLVEVGHRVKGIKGLAFKPVEPVREPVEDLSESVETAPTAESLPTWAKVGNCFLNGSEDLLRIASIDQSHEGIFLLTPTGSRHRLSECRPEPIPIGIR